MLLAEAGLRGARIDELNDHLGFNSETTGAVLAAARPVVIGADKLVDASAYSRLTEAILNEMARYHDTHPNHQGIAPSELRASLPDELADDVFQHALGQLRAEKRIENHGVVLCLAGFDPLAALSEEELRLVAEIERTFRSSGLAAPSFDDVAGRDETRQELFKLLCDTGRLVRLRTDYRHRKYVLHAETLDDVIATIRTNFSYPRKFTLSEVREMLGSSRKYTVPLMEHLDATGVTLRMGNLRQLGDHDRS